MAARSFRSLALLLWVFCLASGQAQNTNRPLTWEECVALAAKNNPDLAASFYAWKASRVFYYRSFNGFLPQLTFSNNYSDSNDFGDGFRWRAQGSASLDLWNAGNIAGIRSAWAEVTQKQANLRQAYVNLRFNLKKAFSQLLFAQKNMEVSGKILEIRRKSAQLVTLRYDSGRESRGNMLKSKAQFMQAQADAGQASRDLRTAQKSLNRQLGLDPFGVVEATGVLEASAPPDIADDAQSLLAGRPDVSVQEAVIKSVEAALSQAWSPFWPSLSASYTRSGSGHSQFPSSQYTWSVGGSLSFPLFGRGPADTFFAVSQARKNLEKAKQDFRSIRSQAVLDLESAWSSFAGSVEQVEVRSALLEAARQRNDEADIRYASGLLSYDNWEIIASERISSERQAIQSRLDAVRAEADWDRAIGKALEE